MEDGNETCSRVGDVAPLNRVRAAQNPLHGYDAREIEKGGTSPIPARGAGTH